MNYSAMIYFNNYSAFRIGTYIDMLKDCSENNYLIDSKIPPHITIGMWNSDDSFLSDIKNLAENTKAFDIIFAGLGIFNSENEKGNIHLAPVKSPELSAFHKSFYNTINLHNGDEYDPMYQNPDIWVPHVTIGYGLVKNQIPNAIKKSLSIGLPQKAVATKIVVAHCCPFKEIATFEFIQPKTN